MASIGEAAYDVEMVTVKYPTTLELLLQQKESRLRSYVDTMSIVGKAASPVNQIGVLVAQAPQPRFAPVTFNTPNYTRPWIFPVDKELVVPVDTFDLLRSIVDPTSGINQAVVAAFNRASDDLIINNAIGSFQTGPDLSNLATTTFDATNDLVADTFGSSASTGMTYPKLVEAWRILRHYQNDLGAETPCVVIGSQQEEDLKRQMEVINEDFSGDTGIVHRGNMEGYKVGGFHVVVTERLQTSASNTLRNCFAFVRSGLVFGLWRDTTTFVDHRPDLASRPWQLTAVATFGAVRTQNHKVIQINCKDSTGADPTAN